MINARPPLGSTLVDVYCVAALRGALIRLFNLLD
jgi:hypothetical protein